MASSSAFVELRERGQVGWLREDVVEHGMDALWQPLEPFPGAKGRGGVGLLQLGALELVVRPYRRGGALGSVLKDRYSGPARARRELDVLVALQAEGVPVVAPVAAVAKRSGAFWRLRICTERLDDALPLPAFLAAHPALRRRTSEAVGTVVRLAFDAGLRHPDLHLDNVLCRPSGDKVRAVLVDLDRARIDPPVKERGRDEMLVRMQRYVVRHGKRLDAVPSRAETMRFLRGLGWTKRERGDGWRRLASKLERSLERRSWLRRRGSGDGANG